MTASLMAGTYNSTMNPGAAAILPKPIDFDLLALTIERILSRHRS